jgi:hypothetical protein
MMKNFFSEKNSNNVPNKEPSINSINEMLKQGERLEQQNKLLDAYHLYRGLTSIKPDCKACRAHMGQVMTKLEDQEGYQL